MSFKTFSTSQSTPGNNKPGDKSKTAPAVNEPEAQPAKKKNEAVPAQKKS